ncbi:MAG: hypothetical protein LQ338_007462 [Usnochroma carphineum]|nr:MAG: hypothetical protein LQ338_007462 [Usnochroma carphineum]
MSIQDRFFADGGLAHNNPSFAIYFHYTRHESKKLTKRVAPTTASAPEFSSHGDLDCSCVRFTNIGTGAKLSEVQPGRRDRLAGLLPGAIRKGIFLQQTLKEIAVNSEEKADVMRQFGYLNPDFIMYERFDANHGVSNIKLDNYNALEEIKEKTKLYLAEQGTKGLLEEVGWSIACDYLNIQPVDEQSRPQSTNSPTAESHQLLQAPKSMSALSAQSSAYSNISERPQNHSHVHSPTDDNLNNTRPASSSQDQAETVPSPGAQTQPRISQEDSGISGIEFEKLTKEPQASMVAAQA